MGTDPKTEGSIRGDIEPRYVDNVPTPSRTGARQHTLVLQGRCTVTRNLVPERIRSGSGRTG